ncbi:MAG: DUF932 domain-containing protein [Armatimonadetes bacterium]|nr:DUF932 domain-containing protein [Armatimonadota bacterium]
MPHLFESGFSVRQPMWHGLGAVLEDHPVDVAATCRLSGLDWQVARRPLYAALDPSDPARTVEVPGKAIIVRLDRANSPEGFLGITTDRYTPVQNEEVVGFCFDLLKAGRDEGHPVQIETAGALAGGKIVWALARLLDMDVTIPSTEDVSQGYLLITAGHDGEHAFKAAVTSVRVVCWNTLSLALRRNKASYTIRHVGNPLQRIKEAAQALGLAWAWVEEFRELAGWLAEQQMNTQGFADFLDELLPLPKIPPRHDGECSEKERDKLERKRAQVQDARHSVTELFESTGTQMPAISGTRWAALQAVTEYSDWVIPVRSRGNLTQHSRRFLRSMVDNEDTLKQKALTVLGR